MSWAIRRHVHGAVTRGVSNAESVLRAIGLSRASVRWRARTSRRKDASPFILRLTVGASRERTRRRAANMAQPRTANGELQSSNATDTHALCVDRRGVSKRTTSSRMRTTPNCVTFSATGARCVFRVIAQHRRTAGARTGNASGPSSNEIAAKRLAQEVLPFGEPR